ncbi:MAG: rhodanese-like domain-containing protein [Gammaproteobacteria bacterium]|uniref:rhodanese-like domain-containing protein n=1 Tax=Rhodoferax sp. TaxID=50421 RepID=UPI0017C096D0|nr:rhodanese-like domain-containing protein [Rhodoferax sp.]MBU3898231.1 rhodanese-like domain-containing protein [Gammaproteobacteria bacterium]MBA3059070.1 rhodanese-like domain-containing protein [Rhodoferax sp.]MBU3996981.1 rhodanese-like domain-containing protein [Gammaproteobacteria bacterium]MBU4081416.1 rhodanese-like domain-containing protein [Gammaproteobacteria bacterium]MBU4114195.1 rhodanese-like domain-containing protein [Gammaproteobacteria bacterium]
MSPNFAKSGLASALLALAAAASAGQPTVNVKQAAVLQSSGALLLDVREADEYIQGHAPGSTLIPLGQLAQRLKELAPFKNTQVVLICRSGRRSQHATEILEAAGFSAAANIEGGMLAWQQAGLPVLTGAALR